RPSPQLLGPPERRLVGRAHLGLGLRDEEVGARADAEPAHAALEPADQVGHWPRARVEVLGVEPRERLGREGRVTHAARQWAGDGERGACAAELAAVGDETERRL